MKPADFHSYKTRYGAAIRSVMEASERGRLNEAGFPAYSHPNRLINWLFWQRLHVAMNYIEKEGPYEKALDFGCGSGVMLSFLADNSQQVIATDIDLTPLERVKQYIPLAENVLVVNASQVPIAQLGSRSFDIISALDVLEHVDDLPHTLRELLNLLKPGGRLVVSGPTENLLYRVGRKLAGPEYSGAYHVRGIREIKHEIARLARVRQVATLYWPIPLFEIFAAEV